MAKRPYPFHVKYKEGLTLTAKYFADPLSIRPTELRLLLGTHAIPLEYKYNGKSCVYLFAEAGLPRHLSHVLEFAPRQQIVEALDDIAQIFIRDKSPGKTQALLMLLRYDLTGSIIFEVSDDPTRVLIDFLKSLFVPPCPHAGKLRPMHFWLYRKLTNVMLPGRYALESGPRSTLYYLVSAGNVDAVEFYFGAKYNYVESREDLLKHCGERLAQISTCAEAKNYVRICELILAQYKVT